MNRTQETFNTSNSNHLMEMVAFLNEKVDRLERNQCYAGWMTIKRAAFLVGLSRDALAQRIVNHDYPEGQVWRQNGRGCSIMINLEELNKII